MDGSVIFTRWARCAPPSSTPLISILAIAVLPPAESLWLFQLPPSPAMACPRPAPFAFKIAPSCMGIWTPSNTCFLGSTQVHIQNSKTARSIQSFLQGSWSWQTDRQTNHSTPSVATGRIYTVLWCGLKITRDINKICYFTLVGTNNHSLIKCNISLI